MNLSPQTKTVLAHLRAERYITSWVAEGVYRIRRLASRVDELVAAGFDINKERTYDATGQAYTRYSLSGKQRLYTYPINPVRPREKLVGLTAVKEAMEAAGLCPCAIAPVLKTLKELA